MSTCNRSENRALGWTAAVILLLACTYTGNANAQTCSITAVPLNFGSYLPNDPVPLDISGSVDVDCRGRRGTFVITIGAGSSNDFGQRLMQSGTDALAYNVYLDAARSRVWGDGTAGTSTFSLFRPSGRLRQSFPVYGRVFAGQDVDPGVYSDNLLVTIIF